MRLKKKYRQLWRASVYIEAEKGFVFNELIGADPDEPDYIGASANIILHAENINKAAELIETGVAERDLRIKFIDRIENIYSLVRYDEIEEDLLKEAESLYSSKERFMICETIWADVKD